MSERNAQIKGVTVPAQEQNDRHKCRNRMIGPEIEQLIVAALTLSTASQQTDSNASRVSVPSHRVSETTTDTERLKQAETQSDETTTVTE